MNGLRIKWLVLAFIFQTRVTVALSPCQRPMPQASGHRLVRAGTRWGVYGGLQGNLVKEIHFPFSEPHFVRPRMYVVKPGNEN